MSTDDIQRLRQARMLLKDTIRKHINFAETDQSLGIAPPPIEKPYPPASPRVALPEPGQWSIPHITLQEAIGQRRSRRRYTRDPVSLDELAFLLWAAQGVRPPIMGGHAFRTVPSAGCRHAFETYIAALNITGLDAGLYRYLPLTHQLLHEAAVDDLEHRVIEATLGQQFAGMAAAVLIWTAIPYRMEWRYGLAAHKVIALDAGHVCQNVYLACEAIGAGTCAIAAYDQELCDALLQVDGEDEFTIYLAPVGKIA